MEAWHPLVVEHLHLAQHAANRWAHRLGHLMSHDEIRATAMCALVRAARCYRPDKRAQFSTFAWMVMNHQVLNEVRDARPHLLPGLDGTEINRQRADPALAEDIRRARAALPGREREVADLVLDDGLTPTEAAVRMGVTKQRGHQLWLRARTKLRKFLVEYVR